jgi:hypothetical protein
MMSNRLRKRDLESAAEKPHALPVVESAIATELKALPRWVAWSYTRRDCRWTKRPIDPKNGRAASATDPSTWSDFETALAFYCAGRSAGLGFVFSEQDPFAGVDLDDVREPAEAGPDDRLPLVIDSGPPGASV